MGCSGEARRRRGAARGGGAAASERRRLGAGLRGPDLGLPGPRQREVAEGHVAAADWARDGGYTCPAGDGHVRRGAEGKG